MTRPTKLAQKIATKCPHLSIYATTQDKARKLDSAGPAPFIKAVEELADAVKSYTTERDYQNVEACRKDQDRLENIMLEKLKSVRALLEEE